MALISGPMNRYHYNYSSLEAKVTRVYNGKKSYETSTLNSSAFTFDLAYLSLISVSGADSTTFLQGQLSCNIKALTETQASLAAYCTAKGRVISVMVVIPQPDGYCLLLPSSLAEIVQKRLQMFVLRSAVKLSLLTTRVIGLKTTETPYPDLELPLNDFAVTSKDSRCLLKIPSVNSDRYIFLDHAKPEVEITDLISADEWRLDDIAAGLPWFELDQTESYTPHMLNLDKLGGISLDKGCYTGQEIIARTHYLGKNKRHLYPGKINSDVEINSGQAVIDPDTSTILGHVLFAQSYNQTTCLLMVLNLENEHSGGYATEHPSLSAIELLQ